MINLLLLIIFKSELHKYKVKPDLLTKGSWVFQTKVLFQISKQQLKTHWCNNKQKTNSFQISHSFHNWIRRMEDKCKIIFQLIISKLLIHSNNTIHSGDSNRLKSQVLEKLKLLHSIFLSLLLVKASNSNK